MPNLKNQFESEVIYMQATIPTEQRSERQIASNILKGSLGNSWCFCNWLFHAAARIIRDGPFCRSQGTSSCIDTFRFDHGSGFIDYRFGTNLRTDWHLVADYFDCHPSDPRSVAWRRVWHFGNLYVRNGIPESARLLLIFPIRHADWWSIERAACTDCSASCLY